MMAVAPMSTVDVAGADACAGQNKQTVLRQEIPEFVHEREDRVRAAIHDGAAADLHDLQPWEERRAIELGQIIAITDLRDDLTGSIVVAMLVNEVYANEVDRLAVVGFCHDCLTLNR